MSGYAMGAARRLPQPGAEAEEFDIRQWFVVLPHLSGERSPQGSGRVFERYRERIGFGETRQELAFIGGGFPPPQIAEAAGNPPQLTGQPWQLLHPTREGEAASLVLQRGRWGRNTDGIAALQEVANL